MTTRSSVAFIGSMRLITGTPKVEEKEDLFGNSASNSNGLSDEDEDCIILETNPFDKEKTNFIINHSRKLSWDSAVCRDVQNVQTNKCDAKKKNDISGDDSDDDCIILERNPFKKVFNIASPLLKHKLESETCRYLSQNMKPYEYVFIDDDDSPVDCFDDKNHVVVESKMFEDEIMNIITKLPNKVSLDSGTDSQNWEEENEISVIAERGQVACRDYPHSRHLCAQHPFNNTPHETYCCQCYCYVCDIKAPCEYWERKLEGHCHASEVDNKWKDLRDAGRQTTAK